MPANDSVDWGNIDKLDQLSRIQLHNRRHRINKLIHDPNTTKEQAKQYKKERRAIDILKTAITSQLRRERSSIRVHKKAIYGNQSKYYGIYEGNVVGPYKSHDSALGAQQRLVKRVEQDKRETDK